MTPLDLVFGTAVVVVGSPLGAIVVVVVVEERLDCVGGKPGGSLRRFLVAKKFPSELSLVL